MGARDDRAARLPLAIVGLPELQLRIPVERATAAAMADTIDAVSTRLASGSAPVTPVAGAVPAAGRRDDGSLRMPPLVAVMMIYLAGAALLLARLALEPLALRRITSTAAGIIDTEWRALFAECLRQMQVRRPVRLLRSAREVMPFTFGTLAPAIVVPPSSDAWTDDRRRAVLLHELAHVARHDCLLTRLFVALRR